MLTVYIDEGTTQLFEHAKGTELAVHIDPMTAGSGENPLEYEVPVVRADQVHRRQLPEQRMSGRKVK